jgi:putative transposase
MFPPFRGARFLTFPTKRREETIRVLKAQDKSLVEILSFCLMPNHFHFILKQTEDEGISSFISKLTNSYTRYFNTKHKRNGHLFQGKFKAIRVETEEQLLHLSRYIHLNPLTSHLIKGVAGLKQYPHSSFPEYIEEAESGLCKKEYILETFANATAYKKFVLNQADYQKELEYIKHLVLEDICN